MIAPPTVAYPLDETSWGAKFDPTEEHTSAQINNETALMIV